MDKLQHFQTELVIELFPPVFQNNPSLVNSGNCMKWSYLCYRIYKNVRLVSYGSHAFVKYKNLYFDSERLAGEKDWRDLPACNFGKGCGKSWCQSCQKAEQVNPNEFKRRWKICNGFQRWSELRELADNFLQ